MLQYVQAMTTQSKNSKTMERPLDKQTVDNICIANGLRNAKELGAASIRQFVSVVKDIEAKTGVEYIRMEIGEPGLPAEMIGIEAEHEALLAGCGSKYPLITGIEPLTNNLELLLVKTHPCWVVRVRVDHTRNTT